MRVPHVQRSLIAPKVGHTYLQAFRPYNPRTCTPFYNLGAPPFALGTKGGMQPAFDWTYISFSRPTSPRS